MNEIVPYPPNCTVTSSTLKKVDREDILKGQHVIPFKDQEREEVVRDNLQQQHNWKQKRGLIREKGKNNKTENIL